jgi:uncharacterized MnhB-related membrane protein
VTALQVATLLAVAATGTATVLTREPVRQAIVAGVFGLALGLLFFAVGAPDVALSEFAVAGIAVPVMVLLALAKLRADEEERE